MSIVPQCLLESHSRLKTCRGTAAPKSVKLHPASAGIRPSGICFYPGLRQPVDLIVGSIPFYFRVFVVIFDNYPR